MKAFLALVLLLAATATVWLVVLPSARASRGGCGTSVVVDDPFGGDAPMMSWQVGGASTCPPALDDAPRDGGGGGPGGGGGVPIYLN